MSEPRSPDGHPSLFGEQEEAQRALHGLEGLSDAAPSRRMYEGPRDPEALLAHFGVPGFRPGQREAVAAALAGRDSLVVMPTGGGKSLCYQLPGLAGEELTVVVSPLIALMADQVKRLAADGHPAVMLASGMRPEESRAAMEAVADGGARIVYCSPERFGSVPFLEAVGRRRVDLFAIDEAHCVSEWGHDFRPDYLRLPRAIERLGRPAVMACTATATPQVADEIEARLGMRDPLRVSSGFDRPNISFDIVPFEGKGSKLRKLAILGAGLENPANRPAIVYCGTRRDAEEVGAALRERGLVAVAYHAGMAPDERASAQYRFMEGDAEVVTATNAFGMGVDKANVRSVWHWSIPTSVEAYYQEAGRAGRDGMPARAVLLAMRADLGRLVRFIEMRAVEPAAVRQALESIRGSVDDTGSLTMEAPRRDEDRVTLAVAERAGACSIEPAPGGRLTVTPAGGYDPDAIDAACRAARDRSWRAYRAVEAFSFAAGCRRRMLLDHFGDSSPAAAQGRCCDVCAGGSWLPDPAQVPLPRRPRAARRDADPAAELSDADADLLAALREWRLRAAAGKPAYTVANNATLEEIAVARPASAEELSRIKGVGPAFLRRHAADVLALVGGGRAAA